MSSPQNETSPAMSEGQVPHISRDSPLRFQGSNEDSPNYSQRFTSPQTPVKAFPPIAKYAAQAEITARVHRMEREMDALKPEVDTYLTVFGGSEHVSEAQTAQKPPNWIKWVGEDGRDRGYFAEDLEWVKSNFKTNAELDKYISDTLTEIEDDLASMANVSSKMRKLLNKRLW